LTSKDAWWEDALNEQTPIGLAMPVVFGYLRIATSSRVLVSAMPVPEALARVREWLARPTVDLLVPGPRYLDIAFGLMESLGTGSNLTTDAQLAAHAIEQDAEVCSNDADSAGSRVCAGWTPSGSDEGQGRRRGQEAHRAHASRGIRAVSHRPGARARPPTGARVA
jgi:uncharacterized protein